MEISSVKLAFLEKIGINLNDLPKEFTKYSFSYQHSVSLEERDFIFSNDYTKSFMLPFSMKDIWGTTHPSYEKMTFLDAFLKAKRGDENVKKFNSNPTYYFEDLKKEDQSELSHNTPLELNRTADGKCYINGGNNRLNILMMLYLAEISNAETLEEKEQIDEKYTFYAKVRSLPKDKDVFGTIFLLNDFYGSDIKFKFKGNDPDDCCYDIMLGEDEIVINNVTELKALLNKVYDLTNLTDSKELYEKIERIVIAWQDSRALLNDLKMKLLEEICPDIEELTKSFIELRRLTLASSSVFDGIDLENVSYENINNIIRNLIKQIKEKQNFERREKIQNTFNDCQTKEELFFKINELTNEKDLDEIFPNYSDFIRFIQEIGREIPDNLTFGTNYESIYNAILAIYLSYKEKELKSLKESEESYKSVLDKSRKQYLVFTNKDELATIDSKDYELKQNLITLKELLEAENDQKKDNESQKRALEEQKEVLKKNRLTRLFRRKAIKNLEKSINDLIANIQNHGINIDKIRMEILRGEDEIKINAKQMEDLYGINILEYQRILEELSKENPSEEELLSHISKIEKLIVALEVSNKEQKLAKLYEKNDLKQKENLSL